MGASRTKKNGRRRGQPSQGQKRTTVRSRRDRPTTLQNGGPPDAQQNEGPPTRMVTAVEREWRRGLCRRGVSKPVYVGWCRWVKVNSRSTMDESWCRPWTLGSQVPEEQ